MNHLLLCLTRLAQLQQESVDRLALQEAAEAADLLPKVSGAPKLQLKTVTRHLQVAAPRWLNGPDAAKMPALVYTQDSEKGQGVDLHPKLTHWGCS
jgi:hypothetical protein